MSGTVVVTGAARGIGRAIGERLQAEGYTVVGVTSATAPGTSFEPVQVDLTSRTAEVVDRAVERRGQPLVAVVNNAGITATPAS